jgi:hypothetical protein
MWVADELKNMDCSDKRLTKRLGLIIERLAAQPESSIPKACNSKSESKGIYRFLSNENIEADTIRDGFRKTTIERINEHPVVLFLSDATHFIYSSREKLNGIGVLRNFKSRGLNLHTTFVSTPDELPLGVVHQVCWGRKAEDYGKRDQRKKLPIEEKESYLWIQSLRAAQSALGDNTHGTFIGDRGADIFELFAEKRKSNMDLLIRSAHDRKTADNTSEIFKELSLKTSPGTMTISIERSGKKKARTAVLEVRFQSVIIIPPANKKKSNLQPININIVSAVEVADGKKVDNGIYWKLLTTLPINCLEDAIHAVVTYSKRWLIERYHYALKQGCSIEKLQLEEADRINKAIAIYTIVAWRIMFLTYLARVQPDAPCTAALTENEWKALHCNIQQTTEPPKDPPTIYKAVLMIAKMGGFLARKSDGLPGLKVIWRGLQCLDSIVRMYCIFTRQPVPQLCG